MPLSSTQSNPLCVSFFVGKDYLRTFDDIEPSLKIYHLYPRLDAWMGRSLPDDVNPRSHQEATLKGQVPEAIESTLTSQPKDFLLSNRGETILAESLKFDAKTGIVTIQLTEWEGDEASHGVADGGTTDAVIARVQRRVLENAGIDCTNLQPIDFNLISSDLIPSYLKEARIHLEVIVGLRDRERIKNLVGGRNTSKAVRSWTMDDFGGNFNWIKDCLEAPDSPFKGRIAYEENAVAPAKILDVLAILTLFHPSYDKPGSAPTVAYSSIGRLNSRLTSEHSSDGYKKLAPLVCSLLELHDFVYVNFNEVYKRKHENARLGARGNRHYGKHFPARKHELSFSGISAEYEIRQGFLYPLLASMRALVQYDDGKASWIEDPKEFFQTHGADLIDVLMEQFSTVNENPQLLGKSKPAYTETFTRAENYVMKKLLRAHR